MNKKPINVNLLATSIMVGAGIYGDGKCVTMSWIAQRILRRAGYPDVKLRYGHAVVDLPYNKSLCICPIARLPMRVAREISVTQMTTTDDDRRFHCWLETDKQIVDVNIKRIHKLVHKSIDTLDLPITSSYYEPILALEVEQSSTYVDQPEYDHIVDNCYNFYSRFYGIKTPQAIEINEGTIKLYLDGRFTWIDKKRDNDNILDTTIKKALTL